MKIHNSYLDNILNSTLFNGITKDEVELIIKCFSPKIRKYKNEQFVILQGDKIENFGLVLKGSVDVIKEDYNGKRKIISRIFPKDVFAETLVLANIRTSPLSVIARCDTDIMFLNLDDIVTTCKENCTYHNTIIKNLLSIVSTKNLNLSEKIEYVSKKTIRQKVGLFLLQESFKNDGKTSFLVSYNRLELSEFLNVERSALSRELSKMKDDGLIDFNKSQFQILDLNSLSEQSN